MKVRENNFCSLIFMEYILSYVELFCYHLNGPSVSSEEKNQLAQSSSMVPTEQLGSVLAACDFQSVTLNKQTSQAA